jgi:hypothetical protein
MRASHRSDLGSMPGHGEPIMNGSPDPAALDRRLSWAMMAGNQQDNAVARVARTFQSCVDG